MGDKYRGAKEAMQDPDALSIVTESLKLFAQADDTEAFAEALANRDFEKALEVGGYDAEELVGALTAMEDSYERLEQRYDMSVFNDVSTSELQEEIDMGDEEYAQILHGAVFYPISEDDLNY